jgi:hypothetical protein
LAQGPLTFLTRSALASTTAFLFVPLIEEDEPDYHEAEAVEQGTQTLAVYTEPFQNERHALETF